MRLRNYILRVSLVLLAGLLAFGVGSQVLANNPQSGPPWVRADGTLDRAQLPECIPAMVRNGELLRDDQGKTVCIPSEELYGSVTPDGRVLPPTRNNPAQILRQHRTPDGVVIETEFQYIDPNE